MRDGSSVYPKVVSACAGAKESGAKSAESAISVASVAPNFRRTDASSASRSHRRPAAPRLAVAHSQMQARIVRKKKARARAARRREQLKKAQEQRAAVYDMLAARMMAKHDPEGTGSISAEAVREAVNETVGHEVDDDVLRQLRSICELSSPEITKPMRTSDLQFLLQASRAYGLQAKRVTEVLQKHDVDKSGALD